MDKREECLEKSYLFTKRKCTTCHKMSPIRYDLYQCMECCWKEYKQLAMRRSPRSFRLDADFAVKEIAEEMQL